GNRHVPRIVARAVASLIAILDRRVENIDPVEMAQPGQRSDRLTVEKRSVSAAEIFDIIAAPLRNDSRVPPRNSLVGDANVAARVPPDNDDVAAQVDSLPGSLPAEDFQDCHNPFPARKV